MPQQENHIRQYSAADFARYHSGKMTEREMHDLEKAALEDPFLSDAFDGYLNTQTPIEDIEDLKNKLIQKSNDKKIIWFNRSGKFPLLRIAAILFVFAVIGWFVYKNYPAKNNDLAKITNQELIKEKQVESGAQQKDSSHLLASNGLLSIENTKDSFLHKGKTSNLNMKFSGSDQTTSTALTRLNTEQTEFYSIKDSDKFRDSIYDLKILPVKDVNIEQVLAGKISGVQVSTYSSNKPKTIKGRVLDNKGNPIAFASVLDKKSNKSIQTDKEGTFAFTTADSSTLVNINAIGYIPATTVLKNDSTVNNLELQESNNTLKEVVVTSAFGLIKSSRAISSNEKLSNAPINSKTNRIKITNAIPLNGWQQFNNYVNDSLRTLQQLGPEAVSAEVSVQFDVNESGKPVNIKINRSICNVCETEALRIIKNGPTWKLNKKRKKAIALVRF